MDLYTGGETDRQISLTAVFIYIETEKSNNCVKNHWLSN